MSGFGASDPLSRSGRLACLCGEYFGPAERPWRQPATAAIAAGFGLSVLAQALVAGVLPIAGSQLAPGGPWVGVPFAAMLAGAVAATFPASFLLDQFGRRAAFALGASLGAAGGLMLAYAILARDFPLLCLGGFWLGIAQGFGLFYRHAAALVPGGTPAAAAAVLGAGALAGLLGPWLAGWAEALAAPYLLLGTAIAATLVQLGALALAVRLPEPPIGVGSSDRAAPAPRSAVLAATAVAAAAWFLMAGAMSTAPLAMSGCGIGMSGVTGALAWHLLAMYAPAPLAGRLALAGGFALPAAGGLALALLGTALLGRVEASSGFSVALGLVGIGWSVAVTAATVRLHAAGRPAPADLATHDGACLLAALAAALAGGTVLG